VLRFHSFGNSTALGPPLSKYNHKLVKSALYSINRHPGCAALFFFALLNRAISCPWLPSPIRGRLFHGVTFWYQNTYSKNWIVEVGTGETTDFEKFFTAYPEFSEMLYIKHFYIEKQLASTPKMSLARIPLTFLVCWAFKKCITPPNPPAAKSERLITNFMEIEWYTQRSPFYATVRFPILR